MLFWRRAGGGGGFLTLPTEATQDLPYHPLRGHNAVHSLLDATDVWCPSEEKEPRCALNVQCLLIAPAPSPPPPPIKWRKRSPSNGQPAAYTRRSGEASDPDDSFSARFYARMREQQAAAFSGPGGRHRYDQPLGGVRVKLFDVFRFGGGEGENVGISKAR